MITGADFVQFMKTLADTDISRSANVKFIVALRDEFLNQNFDADFAEDVISSIEISISDGVLTQDEIEEIAMHFVRMIIKMVDAFEENGFNTPAKMVLKAASKMHIKAEL